MRTPRKSQNIIEIITIGLARTFLLNKRTLGKKHTLRGTNKKTIFQKKMANIKEKTIIDLKNITNSFKSSTYNRILNTLFFDRTDEIHNDDNDNDNDNDNNNDNDDEDNNDNNDDNDFSYRHDNDI